MICEICGKEFEDGNDEDGIPNGITFQFKNGEELTVCSDCVVERKQAVVRRGMELQDEERPTS